MLSVFVCLTAGLYVFLSFFIWFRIEKQIMLYRLVAFFAWLLHGFILYQWIDTPLGQTLGFFTILSQIAWFMLAYLFCLSWKKDPLLPFLIFMFSALSLILGYFYPGNHLMVLGENTLDLAHVLLSLLTLSFIFLAGIQAILLALIEYGLKRYPVIFLSQKWPSLEDSDQRLFQTIKTTVILLTLLLLFSLLQYSLALVLHQEKAILGLLAWGILVSLLIGRRYWGWRGLKGVKWTLLGFILLFLVICL